MISLKLMIEHAYRLGSVIRNSKVIKKLNKVSRKFKWDYSTKFDFMQYDLKIYGENFNMVKIIKINFSVFDFETHVSIYREEKTKDGTIEIPCDLDFTELKIISDFVEKVEDEFKLNLQEKRKTESPSYVEAYTIFGKELVKTI